MKPWDTTADCLLLSAVRFLGSWCVHMDYMWCNRLQYVSAATYVPLALQSRAETLLVRNCAHSVSCKQGDGGGERMGGCEERMRRGVWRKGEGCEERAGGVWREGGRGVKRMHRQWDKKSGQTEVKGRKRVGNTVQRRNVVFKSSAFLSHTHILVPHSASSVATSKHVHTLNLIDKLSYNVCTYVHTQ